MVEVIRQMRTIVLKILVTVIYVSLAGQAQADFIVRAESPDASDGIIQKSQPFAVDIWIDLIADSDLTGGGFSFRLYSPDQDISDITHIDIDGALSSGSVEYLNNFDSYYSVLLKGDENGFDGNLPDSVNFSFLTFVGGLPAGNPDLPYIRFNLQIDTEGTFCIDSCTHQSNTDWNWLFPSPYHPVSFNGPYCWEIMAPPGDDPPQLACPQTIILECGDSTDPSSTGFPAAIDDNDPSPIITFSDVVESGCPAVLSRTWSATDNLGQSSLCVQSITLEDNAAPALTCPEDIVILPNDPTDPSFTGQATAIDCGYGLQITYDDIQNENVITRTWQASDDCGNTESCIQTITIDMSTDLDYSESRLLPDEFSLKQNYPNPFNPITAIAFALPEASNWSLDIYNLVGRKVASFVGQDRAGYVSVNWDASDQASGFYIYRLEAGKSFTQSKKMILLK
jgi:hypothetical protein